MTYFFISYIFIQILLGTKHVFGLYVNLNIILGWMIFFDPALILARPEGKLSAITISTGREEDFPSNSKFFFLEFGDFSSSKYIFGWRKLTNEQCKFITASFGSYQHRQICIGEWFASQNLHVSFSDMIYKSFKVKELSREKCQVC